MKRVENEDVLRRAPVDRLARLVTLPALWIHRPEAFGRVKIEKQVEKPKRKRRRKKMSHNSNNLITGGEAGKTTLAGFEINIRRTGKGEGQEWCSVDDLHEILLQRVEELAAGKPFTPLVQRAQDARRVVREIMEGLGVELNNLEDKVTKHLESVRLTRLAVVAETSAISHPLREIRQFFMGPDYKNEMSRLKEFVELCERLQSLKESGFLDKMADTMLALNP